jgi:hypothetical protein
MGMHCSRRFGGVIPAPVPDPGHRASGLRSGLALGVI